MLSNYHQSVLTLMSINVVAVTGVALLTGFTGLFSFGHAGYMSIGAYTAAMLVVRAKLPFLLALPLGGAMACLVSLIMYPTLRLKGDYFAIAALGFGEAVRLIMDNGGTFTGGARGFPGIPTMTRLPVALVFAALALYFMRNILYSRFGRALIAIREDRLAAQSLGINVAHSQMMSLAISAFYCGTAGGLFAFFMSFVQPRMFDMAKSTELASSIVFGGLGSLTGSAVAAGILTSIPEVFRPLMTWRMVFYGLALVLTIVLRPSGLLGTWELSVNGILKVFGVSRDWTPGSRPPAGTGAGAAGATGGLGPRTPGRSGGGK
ncbi:MAG: branched-chain amino acid ABC transporter permease [Firmicutes bacterium]|nr:branched-chain amino acid ABC transporter permease [Bacillota bacterium]